MDVISLEKDIKNKKFKRCYILYGEDEALIQDIVSTIIKDTLDPSFLDLNLLRIDGIKEGFEVIENATETLPFMSEKKVVEVYRAEFLSWEKDKKGEQTFKKIAKYIDTLPDHCILILYYVFKEQRDKITPEVNRIKGDVAVVKVDKLKGEKLYKKVENIFIQNGKPIGKIELRFFVDNVDNNMRIINNEIDKLISYTEGRNITKQDILDLFSQKSEKDIFNMVDFLSQKRPEKATNILNELIFKGEKENYILSMIERQFKILFNLKLGMSKGKSKEILSRELKLNIYICDKMMHQSEKFSFKQLKRCMELCINSERNLKTLSLNKKTELELLIINTVM
ncbi:DNA polymerase III subunit delta [Clostridium algidicarnis]|uniref:DNA polymerase III subunit delta n=2 Tax=Clostridium algidicarnis TaxID=37659 RepID=A0A2S6G0S8_9CLOT|nr:DNA polymerase III subunit delta [Clostridium algidicarnis]MBB6630485.1 DNA polymerase III subunit delta [Clostridium algidicarnis]MBB6696378.1 DNA polymerase III subunit delta [Clostridium algidicarnis]MBU3193597.1 DNA polymerase III subunit delta [Clostridium algidicarnis]MBU3202997.1 DNA polymerase III subunit delta [Clostridium algidicarnis]MBU3205704.1 DNA polymerase III subunit delta [Clostridium algidicarnis]